MQKRHKCPKCQTKIFKIVETLKDGKVAVMCNNCETVYFGFKRNNQDDPIIANAVAAAQVPQ